MAGDVFIFFTVKESHKKAQTNSPTGNKQKNIFNAAEVSLFNLFTQFITICCYTKVLLKKRILLSH